MATLPAAALPHPYEFVRLVTLALATVWTLTALWRLVRFVRRWERRFERWGLEPLWIRRAMVIVVARATVLDPINLALLLLLAAIWWLRAAL